MVTAKDAARSVVSAASEDLIGLSHRIHAHPELGFEEEMSSAWVAGALAVTGTPVSHTGGQR